MTGQHHKNRVLTFTRWTFFCCIILCLSLLSCRKNGGGTPPITGWEDNGADSVALSVLVQTNQGQILAQQNVSLALSQDSLNNKILVRRQLTGNTGRAVFRKLYPRRIFYYCIAVYNGNIFSGFGNISLRPGDARDTTLIVY